jgi:hypothetical protein
MRRWASLYLAIESFHGEEITDNLTEPEKIKDIFGSVLGNILKKR